MTNDRKHRASPTFNVNTPQAGGFISAGEFRQLKELVRDLVKEWLRTDPAATHIRLFRLTESIGPEFDDSSDWRGKEGTVQYWDGTAQLWRDTNPADSRENISDAFNLIWDKDDVVVAFYHSQAQQWVPINARTIRAVITVPDEDGDYPDSSYSPNKFPVKFVRLTYVQSAGYEAPTMTYVDSGTGTPADVGPDDYVMNLYEELDGDCDCGSRYIPCYTVMWAWQQNDRWFTHTCCHNDVSSQSSYSSSSHSSESSSSESSISTSSESSASSQSSASSLSSLSSQSSTSSLSSQSSLSSSESSQSSVSSLSSLSSQSASSQSSVSQSSESSLSESSQSASSQSASSQSPSSGQSSASSTVSEVSGASSKSAAIVPAAWSPFGYTALFVEESPEVRFDDVMVVEVNASESGNDFYIPIDFKFIDVCERDSIVVCGCQSNLPVLVGATMEHDRVRVRLGESSELSSEPLILQLVICLTGIRKGFAGVRFPERTREQFLANERFLRSAYPGAGR
jgi:hypothetical protein